MDLRQKRKLELENIKNQKMEAVIGAALKVFLEQGIENTKMTDIAEQAEIGIASLYRYFKTKPEIAVEAACRLWQEEIESVNELISVKLQQALSGKEQVASILQTFLELFHYHQEFLKFIDEFDRYIAKEQVPLEKLEKYEKSIIDLKTVMMTAIEHGRGDGSIRKDFDAEAYYFSTTHALMTLSQKLALRGRLLESDNIIQGEQQMQIIIEMAVRYLG
jgi:AcrR family transcriptional regulator